MRVSIFCSWFFVLAACAPRALPVTAEHPVNPEAPTGRLAGPPAALRPGVVQVIEPTAPDAVPAATGHEHHGHGAPAAEPAKPAEPVKTESKPKAAPKPKTAPKPKAQPKQNEADPHKGHH